MWQKGTGPRPNYKELAKASSPGLFCRRKVSGSLVGYVVYAKGSVYGGESRVVASARTAEKAWEKAYLAGLRGPRR